MVKFEETVLKESPAGGVNRIHVTGVNGGITVQAMETDVVTVRATKRARAATEEAAQAIADQIEIVVEQQDDVLVVKHTHPAPGYRQDVSVSYAIECPKRLTVVVKTSNGAIQIKDAEGGVEAETSNGGIQLHEIKGRVEARTSNGRISVHAAGETEEPVNLKTSNGAIQASIAGKARSIRAESSNGAIDVHLPENFSGMIRSRTSNGSIHCDFPVRTKSWDKQYLEGEIGKGGRNLVLVETTNGKISIHQRP